MPAFVAAQSASSSAPTFEVASIKPSAPDARGLFTRVLPGAKFNTQNSTLRSLIQFAYRVRAYQITEGPAWIDNDRYDVNAEAAEGTPQKLLPEMMQSLLAERFKLADHRETREMPVYFLTEAKGGMKLKESKEGSCVTPGPNWPPPPPARGERSQNFCGVMRISAKGLDGTKIGMQELTMFFSDVLGRSVIDRTDFKGSFDAHMEFARDEALAAGNLSGAGHGGPDAAPPSDPNAPSIFTAAQEQLGLRIESGKAPVEMIVVDHGEKPSEN